MKICIASDPYYPYPSGVSEYTHHLAKYLRKFGHQVKILTTHYPGEEEEEGVERIGRVFYIPMNKSFATCSVGMEIPLKVKEFLKRERFDIVHMNGPFPPSISFFALHYSTSVNISTFHSTGFRFFKSGSLIVRRLFKRYIEKLHGLIAVSPTARDTISPYIPGEYEIIPNGVDVERFNPGVAPQEEFKNERRKILYLGRLDRRKGLVELLRAFPLIKREIPDAFLIVVGKGPLEKECKRLANSLGLSDSVLFKGFAPSSDIPSYYASCDLYCSPALGGESFGIVLLEAMAVGKPVVASRIIGYDTVIRDGYNGLLFNPEEPEDIARTILRVLKDRELREGLIKNGLEFVKEYTWERIARKIEGFYFETMKRIRI